jgi:hypothetical protein
VQTALHAAPEARLDWHLGRGVGFTLGPDRQTSLELFPQVVRVTVPQGHLAVARREAEVGPDGVVFQDPEQFFLSVGPTGEVLFQYFPPSASGARDERERQPGSVPAPTPDRSPGSPPPLPETADKPKSERYVGIMGPVHTHRTKQGKLVAEVELSVPDPDRPGSSRLVKFAAFGEKAEALARDYQAGQTVTAVGIPHELKRRGKNGREWIERQLYFVQLPKPR